MLSNIRIFCLVVTVATRFSSATTYYVSPKGNDTADGKSSNHAWKTIAKVNDAKFLPGDKILFQRGGEWHDHLQASSDGSASAPIIYDAFGKGAKPKIWGSDVLDNSKFTPVGDGKYAYSIETQADSALVDHVFLESVWSNGTLTITTATDPRTDHKVYTACLRGNVILSNRKNHLAFKNLVVDETAGQLNDGGNQGYGVRIEGSTDVLLDSCEALRCGRHNFACINSTGFVGRHLVAAYALPKMPGDNTAYVSYADAGAPVEHCTSEWDDISANHMEDGKGGKFLDFVSHGDRQGLITIKNSTFDTKISFMSAPAIVKHVTLKDNASIENFGTGILIDGVTLLDSSAIDQWATNGIIQNCIAHLIPSGGGPTGYRTAVLCRDKANGNVIRFNTLVTGDFSCLELAGESSRTKWYGNIMQSNGAVIAKGNGNLHSTDVATADSNFYPVNATFAGLSFNGWQAQGFDQHSATGLAGFMSASDGNFHLKPGSPANRVVSVNAGNMPQFDAEDKKRSTQRRTIGALENAN